jgi:hypothetical protein
VAAEWGNGARVADPDGVSCAVEGRTPPGRRRRGTRAAATRVSVGEAERRGGE